MSRYPIDTRILIDGLEAYDRASDLAAGRPTVLDGLSLEWGRSSPVDQPEVGSCRFRVREQLEEPQPERVTARNLALDPSFEYGTGGFQTTATGEIAQDTAHARTGDYSMRVTTTESGGGFHTDCNLEMPRATGDLITARAWVYYPDLTPPLSAWNGNANYGALAVLPAPGGTPGGADQILEWTATVDQTTNGNLFGSGRLPVDSAAEFDGSFYIRKGNATAPDEMRMLLLCYNDTGYLGAAAMPGVDNQHIPVQMDDWTFFDFSGVDLQPGTTEVTFAIYAPNTASGGTYAPGDKVQVAAPLLTWRDNARPRLRIGGAGVNAELSPDFTGPYNKWAPVEVTAEVTDADRNAVLYIFGSEHVSDQVWFDDLSITVNHEPVDFTGDTAPENPGTITATFKQLGGIPPQRGYEAWPLLYETPTGAWILGYKSGETHMPISDSVSVLQRSTDQGHTWTQVAAIGEPGVNVGGTQIAIGTDQSLNMITTWNTSGEQGSAGDFRIYRSVDDGLTWTEQIRYPWTMSTFGKPLTLHNGDLLASWHGGGWGGVRSTDNGLTWTVENWNNGGYYMNEGRIVQIDDGTLIGIGRSGNLNIFYSYDNGHTWTQGVDTQTATYEGSGNVNTEGLILTGDRLEMIWINREKLAMFYTSADVHELLNDPTAWTPPIELGRLSAAGMGDLGYPTMLYRDNGAMVVAYYADPQRDHTPSIYTGLIRTQHQPGPGWRHRWVGQPGNSPSERFLPATVPAPVLGTIASGSTVEVWAQAGDIPPPEDQVIDLQFRTPGPLADNLWDNDTAGLTADVSSRFGRQAAWIHRPGDYQPWSGHVVFPPAEHPEEGLDPDAWDHIGRLLPGQAWQMSITALLPPGAEAQLTAWAVTDPHQSTPPTVCPVTASFDSPDSVPIPADHGWHQISGIVTLPPSMTDPAGGWILPGIQITRMPSATTWEQLPDRWIDYRRRWVDWQRAGINHVGLTQTVSTTRHVLVWAGEVVTTQASAAGDQAVTIDVSAVDPSAPLNMESIGDQPWSVQSVTTRISRILRLSRFDTLDLIIDPGMADYQLTYRDVDAQPVLGLLQDVATSAGGVLWVATHATIGTYMWLENPATRAAVRAFTLTADGMLTITGHAGGVSLLSSADILRDPLQVSQDSTSTLTSVDVGWQQQGTDDDGKPTTESRTVTRTDDNAASRHGIRKLSVDTELITETDAGDLADRHLARARATDWTLSGVTVDGRTLTRPINDVDDPARVTTTLDLLDGTRRVGRPITILDLPAWMTARQAFSGYLEGGTYTLTDGRWDLDLTLSAGQTQGDSATWEQLPVAAAWADVAPAITWADAYGVTAPTTNDLEAVNA